MLHLMLSNDIYCLTQCRLILSSVIPCLLPTSCLLVLEYTSRVIIRDPITHQLVSYKGKIHPSNVTEMLEIRAGAVRRG